MDAFFGEPVSIYLKEYDKDTGDRFIDGRIIERDALGILIKPTPRGPIQFRHWSAIERVTEKSE